MSVWYCIPSARPAEEAEKCLSKWRERGYKIAVYLDEVETKADEVLVGNYPGYARAVNRLVQIVMKYHADADWFVTGGDDVWPDPNHSAEEIAWECSEHFSDTRLVDLHRGRPDPVFYNWLEYEKFRTFGVMQPTGDRWEVNGPGTVPGIDLVAGSPWMGRSFCERVNQGKGPLWPEYFHMGEDEELQAVAMKLGIFWQRPDLTHYHDHWGRPRDGERMGQAHRMPEFLKRANSAEEWKRYKKLFAERQAAGFPGHEPL